MTFKSFLHAYFRIACRENAGTEPTNIFLSCIVLSNRHSLRLPQSLFVFKSAAALGKRQTCAAALMTAKSLIRQPWHTVYCHLEFGYSDLRANYPTLGMLTLSKIDAVKTKHPRVVEEFTCSQVYAFTSFRRQLVNK